MTTPTDVNINMDLELTYPVIVIQEYENIAETKQITKKYGIPIYVKMADLPPVPLFSLQIGEAKFHDCRILDYKEGIAKISYEMGEWPEGYDIMLVEHPSTKEITKNRK